jgi:hypothetical protein
MNVGIATGLLGSAAGAPLSQTAGAETERTQKDSAGARRAVDGQKRARKLPASAQRRKTTSHERDADGRRLWEETGRRKPRPDDGGGGRRTHRDERQLAQLTG